MIQDICWKLSIHLTNVISDHENTLNCNRPWSINKSLFITSSEAF